MTAPRILEAIDHPAIWRPWFRDPATWAPWRVVLAALFGLPLDAAGLDLYRRATGRTAPPPGGATEAWLICGRRAGKSFVLALVAVYLAVFKDWKPYLAPGEIGTVKVIACDRRQARVICRYARALVTQVSALAALIERLSEEEIALTKGITIEIQTASFRSVRGYTLIAALCDEVAFWSTDDGAANPDTEILAALRPASATVPNAMLLLASSPYSRRGELYAAFRRYWGQDDAPTLVWRADTRTMNPTVPQAVIDEALARDPAKAAAEFNAEFRTDIESFIAREVVETAIVPGRYELPPGAATGYTAFVDPSGGSADSFTLAVAHHEADGRVVLDCLRERRPPFSPEAVTAEFAATIKSYGLRACRGDRYAGEWPRERFAMCGVEYSTAGKAKSDLYLELLPLLNAGRIELLDHPRLAAQLVGLERRTARGGRDSVDHPPGAHDDLCNSAAGALVLAARAPEVVLGTPILVTAPRGSLLEQAGGDTYRAYLSSLGVRHSDDWSGGGRDEWSY